MKPARIITMWSPILINRQHVSLSGEDQYGEHWVSTTLAELDVEAKTATTISGRPYRLHGEPDPEYALRQALSIMSRAYDLTGTTVEAITLEEADAWLRGLPEQPRLSDEDMDRNEKNRRLETWTWLRLEAVASGLDDIALSGVTELPLHIVQALRLGNDDLLDDVTTYEAEEGLGRLKDWRNRGWRM